ncbi:RHS repeat domain-containing protein [Facilibium subflavum]|uniref:RHS repeat domain-containing protein n=1 Tax=Facilibium subflavum TaxID=2219058 RepID=UPI000E6512B6|nr:RHS repeat-associated core domain-containing protein [Facilibium subflavum]
MEIKKIISVALGLSISVSSMANDFSYDANGNLIRDSQNHHYRYNADNQLIRVIVNGKAKSQMHYNAKGLRDGRKVNHEQLGLIYEDGNIVDAVEVKANKTSAYLKQDVRYVDDGMGETSQYLGHGNKNSTRLLLDANSTLQHTYNYSAYGNNRALQKRTSANDKGGVDHQYLIDQNPLTYDGEYQDSDTGLVYLRARFYNPDIMGFMQRDSYHLINRYNAFNNNPINNVDPNGHFSFSSLIPFYGAVTSAKNGNWGEFTANMVVNIASIAFATGVGVSIR